ncbi:hypothetical protein [Mycolicibacterium cosmeticum]|uniref:hypothetical protein n=1 Tax=Mycolicibacterium cosmeticum TaxID=258533 RepID=UPI003204E00C
MVSPLPAIPPPSRVVVVSAALVAVLGVFEIASGPHPRDDTSFRAGYAAVTNGSVVRAALATPGMTPSTFCIALAETTPSPRDSPTLVAGDFVAGCRRAVTDAME